MIVQEDNREHPATKSGRSGAAARRIETPTAFGAWPKHLCLLVILGLFVSIDVRLGGTTIRLSLSDLVAPLALAALCLERGAVTTLIARLRTPAIGIFILAAATMAVSLPLSPAEGAISGNTWVWSLARLVALAGCASYVLLGLAMAHALDAPDIRRLFVAIFVASAAMGLAFLTSRLLLPAETGLFSNYDRFVGLQANPNAMAILCLGSVAAALGALRSGHLVISAAASGIAIFTVIATGSAAATISVLPLLIGGLVNRILPIARLALALAFAVGLAALLTNSYPEGRFDPSEQMISKVLPSHEQNSEETDAYVYESSTGERLRRFRQALSLWSDAPIAGAGLGAILRVQIEADPPSDHPTIVHNSYLWILAETGLIGFGAWLAFAIAVGIRLKPFSLRDQPAPELAATIVLFLAGWAAMMMFHEMLFQRLPWLAIGIGLGLAAQSRTAGPETSSGDVR